MAEGLHRCQVARREYLCDGMAHDCYNRILAGDRYWRSALPPNSETGNTGWWHHRLCFRCALFYDVLTDEEKLSSLGAVGHGES